MNKSSFFIELEAPIFLITLFVFIYSCEFYPSGEKKEWGYYREMVHVVSHVGMIGIGLVLVAYIQTSGVVFKSNFINTIYASLSL